MIILTLKAIKQARALNRQITHRINLVNPFDVESPDAPTSNPRQGMGLSRMPNQEEGGVDKKKKR